MTTTTAAAPDVTALLLLPGSRFPLHLLLPLDDVQRQDVHDLPAIEDAPDAFAVHPTRLLIGYHAQRLTLAVFRARTPGLFLAFPYSGDVEGSRAVAAAMRGPA